MKGTGRFLALGLLAMALVSAPILRAAEAAPLTVTYYYMPG